jgi:hypothetical protein
MADNQLTGHLDAFFQGNRLIVRGMVALYIEKMPLLLDQLDAQFVAGDQAAMFATVRRMRSNLRLMEERSIDRGLIDLEVSIQANASRDHIKQQISINASMIEASCLTFQAVLLGD